MYGEPAYFAVVEQHGRSWAPRCGPRRTTCILSEVDDVAAIGPLVEDARSAFGSLPGVSARRSRSARLRPRGRPKARIEIEQRVFARRPRRRAGGLPGRMRDYERSDRELAGQLHGRFTEEALPEPPPGSSEEFVDRREEDPDGGIVFWEDGGAVVSMAGFGGLTPNGIRIGPVYTPPELRGRGYASALTAELTQRLLDGGRRFCFLFTDLANPTSNSIYQRIGYEAVSDVDLWTFSG